MGGSTITNKAKPKKWQVGSDGYTHLSNNIHSSINQYSPCTKRDILSETPSVDTQSTKKHAIYNPNLQNYFSTLGITILPVVKVRP